MEFNNLPSDIKQLIFNNNRESNNKINRDKKLREFWDESLRSEDEGGSDKLTDPNYDRETGEYIN